MEAGVYSHTLTIQVCAAGQGMVFRPSSLELGQYINQENNVGNRVYNYIKLINSIIQVAINSLHDIHIQCMDMYWILNTRNSIFGFNTCCYCNH